MTYQLKNFDSLLGMQGFSDKLLKNHFTLYQGYVNNTNKLIETLIVLMKEGKLNTPEYAELKRRFGWEFNGMRLHELYFANISKKPSKLEKNSKLLKKITENFETFENWEKDFKASASMRGIGWVILYYDKQNDQLFNAWINEHDIGHLSTAVPLLIIDVFEHAFMLDYELKRIDYIEAFFKVIDWSVVEKRFDQASK